MRGASALDIGPLKAGFIRVRDGLRAANPLSSKDNLPFPQCKGSPLRFDELMLGTIIWWLTFRLARWLKIKLAFIFQAFLSLFRPFSAGEGFSYCIKICIYIDSLCSSGDFLLEISIFPFAECTPYEHPQVSVCRVQGVIHLYAL